jgi:hypothetical protein
MKALALITTFFATQALGSCPAPTWQPLRIPDATVSSLEIDPPIATSPWKAVSSWRRDHFKVHLQRNIEGEESLDQASKLVVQSDSEGNHWTRTIWEGTAHLPDSVHVENLVTYTLDPKAPPVLLVRYLVSGPEEPALGPPVEDRLAALDSSTGTIIWNGRIAYRQSDRILCKNQIRLADLDCDGRMEWDETAQCVGNTGNSPTTERRLWHRKANDAPLTKLATAEPETTSGFIVIAGSYSMLKMAGRKAAETKYEALKKAGFPKAHIIPSTAYYSLACGYWTVSVGVFKRRASAIDVVKTLRNAGFQAYSKQIQPNPPHAPVPTVR